LFNSSAGRWKTPTCCVVPIYRDHCSVQHVRLIPHNFARLASGYFWTAWKKDFSTTC